MSTTTAPAVRTQDSLVIDIINSTTPSGVALNEEMLAALYKEVDASTFVAGQTKHFVATVKNTPTSNTAANSKFTPNFDGHLGAYLFSVDLIETRKADSMWAAFEEAGGEALDLNVASRFGMRVDVPLTVRVPNVPNAQRVMKHQTIDVLVGLALSKEEGKVGDIVTDEFGQPVLEVKSYSVRGPEVLQGSRRRRPLNVESASDDTAPEGK